MPKHQINLLVVLILPQAGVRGRQLRVAMTGVTGLFHLETRPILKPQNSFFYVEICLMGTMKPAQMNLLVN